MSSYRFSAKIISRKKGHSSVAAAAYRAGEKILDEQTKITYDYRPRYGVLHTEILAPDDAPEWVHDRAQLWNTVEAKERRYDAQLAREIQFSLPHEIEHEKHRNLMREFLTDKCVSRGMIADLAIHAPDPDSDRRNHHAHVLLTMRHISENGFGKKERSWNSPELLE